jgi:RNA 3'-terminal phosphate cyclase-like protein
VASALSTSHSRHSADEAARSPGYALSLLAESTTGALHCSEAVSKPGVTPEDLALAASRALLLEIKSRGCVDRQHQSLVLLMMALGSEDVGKCCMGEPTPRT